MSTTQVIKPNVGDKVHRMSNENLGEDEKGIKIPNTEGNIVKFKVEYPKDSKAEVIKGAPYYVLKKDSVHELHVVHANALVEKGLGTILKDK